jgi:hypothetical protein
MGDVVVGGIVGGLVSGVVVVWVGDELLVDLLSRRLDWKLCEGIRWVEGNGEETKGTLERGLLRFFSTNVTLSWYMYLAWK